MRILFLDQFSDLGGAQHVLLDTLEAAEQRGWNVHVALPPGGPLIEQLRSRSLPVIEIPCGPYRSREKSVGDLVRFVSDIRKQNQILANFATRIEFDLIYVNGPRLLPAAAALASRQGRAVLFHAHSHVEQGPARLLAGRNVRRARASVVACSQSVLEQYRRYANHASVTVIPNGVREIPFRQRDFSARAGWRIGLIGRISLEKGQAEFVRAAALLRSQFPDARFVICGAPLFADPSYYATVQRQAQGLPVEFLGWRDDVASVLAELDLLVVPSKLEGMGRVVLEAFSAGVAVVAFPTGGTPEAVIDGETGFLTRGRTPEALAARITDVFTSDAETLRTIAANARRSWEQSYTPEIYKRRITGWMERQVSDWRAAHETGAPPPRK